MKVLLIALLAVVVVPLIFSIFQNQSYQNKLKPEVLSQVSNVLAEQGLEGLTPKIDHLDVMISGSVDAEDLDKVKAAKKAIDEIGSGAVRPSSTGFDVKVNGKLAVSKSGEALVFSGYVNELDSVKNQLSEGLTTLKSEDAPELKKDDLYNDSPVISSAALKDWSNQFLALPGDRGFSISAKDDIVRPVGKMTADLKNQLTQLAQDSGLELDPSGFDIVDPGPAEFNLSQSNGAVSLKARTPLGYDPSPIFPSARIDNNPDPFTQVHPSLERPEFATWVKSYFDAKGDRGLNIVGDAVTMTGAATPSLERVWTQDLQILKLQPSSDLTLYPSQFHYPGYQRESQLTPEQEKPLLEAFALNQIFFDSGSNEVREDQLEKITALQEAIEAAGEENKFIIGGHADSTGDIELNQRLSKKRAESVVAALAEKGIAEDRFTIASFGAAKAASSGSNESDRKVEILLR